ncbi:MAG: hypothetical protein QOF48_428 [Verrucomicrobiota bacterium]
MIATALARLAAMAYKLFAAVAVNQPCSVFRQNRMTTTLRQMAATVTAFIHSGDCREESFNEIACELFAFQFQHNRALQALCANRGQLSDSVSEWKRIPAVPASAFKECEMTTVPLSMRVAEFHSSGTSEQRPSRHFHSHDSLAVYESSLLHSFHSRLVAPEASIPTPIFLTPSPEVAPHSSLVHMLETIRRHYGMRSQVFFGAVGTNGSWELQFEKLFAALERAGPKTLFGTAFHFVHLLDRLAAENRRLPLPAGSLVIETGGYKGRSRVLQKEELHKALSVALGVSTNAIVCEYGMCELSSQAYDVSANGVRRFRFPPWVRFQIISPETGEETQENEPGLLRVCDLANIASALVVETGDLAIRDGDGFRLMGRAARVEPRGCSLMAS